jgi:CheY-like chemotaxis protein
LLEDLGYRVWVAENGLQGIELFSRIHPDLVITDMLMPEVDGFETIRRIRSAAPTTPIIAMSAAVNESRMEREIQGGILCCVQKPIDETVLIELLRAMLEPEPQ